MTMYLDSAILVKLLTSEPDSSFFQDSLEGKILSSSELASAEVLSALFSKERAKLVSVRHRERAWKTFTDRLAVREIVLLPIESRILVHARHVLESCHPKVSLRSLDAIHLASCHLTGTYPLCTTDKRMREGAARMHIPLFP